MTDHEMHRTWTRAPRALPATMLLVALIACGAVGFMATINYLERKERPTNEAVQTEFFSAGADGARLLGAGWFMPEPWGTWSNGASAELVWRPGPRPVGGVQMRVEGRVFPFHGDKTQVIHVHVNGARVGTIEANTDGNIRNPSFDIPDSVVAESIPLKIVFQITQPTSPQDMRISGDARKIGLGLTAVTLRFRAEQARPGAGAFVRTLASSAAGDVSDMNPPLPVLSSRS